MTPPAPPAPPPSYPGSGILAKVAAVRKAVAAVVGLGLTYATLYFNTPGDARWIALAIGIASALGVYSVPNGTKP